MMIFQIMTDQRAEESKSAIMIKITWTMMIMFMMLIAMNFFKKEEII